MMVALMRLWRPAMTLAPDEQHARLRIERSLRRDPAPRAAARVQPRMSVREESGA